MTAKTHQQTHRILYVRLLNKSYWYVTHFPIHFCCLKWTHLNTSCKTYEEWLLKYKAKIFLQINSKQPLTILFVLTITNKKSGVSEQGYQSIYFQWWWKFYKVKIAIRLWNNPEESLLSRSIDCDKNLVWWLFLIRFPPSNLHQPSHLSVLVKVSSPAC